MVKEAIKKNLQKLKAPVDFYNEGFNPTNADNLTDINGYPRFGM